MSAETTQRYVDMLLLEEAKQLLWSEVSKNPDWRLTLRNGVWRVYRTEERMRTSDRLSVEVCLDMVAFIKSENRNV